MKLYIFTNYVIYLFPLVSNCSSEHQFRSEEFKKKKKSWCMNSQSLVAVSCIYIRRTESWPQPTWVYAIRMVLGSRRSRAMLFSLSILNLNIISEPVLFEIFLSPFLLRTENGNPASIQRFFMKKRYYNFFFKI